MGISATFAAGDRKPRGVESGKWVATGAWPVAYAPPEAGTPRRLHAGFDWRGEDRYAPVQIL